MIQRRVLLQSLLGVLADAGVPWRSPRAAPLRPILIQESPLAGFQYHEGERLWTQMCVGQPLTLVRETGNPYDSKAVRVDWQGQKLGYVPRVENTAVAQMLDRGERLTARIVRLKEDQNPWERVWFTMVLEI